MENHLQRHLSTSLKNITNNKSMFNKLSKQRRREMYSVALEGGDTGRGYCSCDDQMTKSSSPPTTTSISPTNSFDHVTCNEATICHEHHHCDNNNSIMQHVNINRKRSQTLLKQQYHVRFSDEKNFSD